MHAHTGSIVTIITLLRNTFKHFGTCTHITASVTTLEKSYASRSFKTIIITTLSCRRDPHKTCTRFQARHTRATNLLGRATVKARRSLQALRGAGHLPEKQHVDLGQSHPCRESLSSPCVSHTRKYPALSYITLPLVRYCVTHSTIFHANTLTRWARSQK